MAKLPDLKDLSGKQLQQVIDNAQALLAERRAQKLQELRDKWASEAAEEGIALGDIFAPKGKGKKGSGGLVEPKYRAPDGTLWAGRGRAPKVFQDLFNAGHPREEFLIKK